MYKKRILLVFLMCCLVLPIFTSLYQTIQRTKATVVALSLLSEEEENGHKKEKEDKDKEYTYLDFSAYLIFLHHTTTPFALAADKLLISHLDSPTPPPKFS